MNKVSIIAGTLALSAAILPAAAFAQTVNVNTASAVATPIVSTSVTAKAGFSLSTAISRGDAEITRRITNLNSLSTRVGAMTKVSASDKSSLQSSISAQISELTSLKAKIDVDTVAATLKTDIQSITADYRIYMLVLPQGRIAAAVDRIQTIYADMQALSPKLEARITAAQTAGVNVTAAQSAYSDMQTQMTNANADATAALSETASLSPDQGNATVEASNTAAIKDAASKIKSAAADLKAARADITTILNAVKGTGTASATASVRTTP